MHVRTAADCSCVMAPFCSCSVWRPEQTHVQEESLWCRFSTSLAAHSERLPASTPGGKPHAAPRLFLEPKQNTYKSDSLAKLWDLVEELELQV